MQCGYQPQPIKSSGLRACYFFFIDTRVCYRLSDTVCICCIYRSAKRCFITPSLGLIYDPLPADIVLAALLHRRECLALEGSSSLLCSLSLCHALRSLASGFTLHTSSEPSNRRRSQKRKNLWIYCEFAPFVSTLTS